MLGNSVSIWSRRGRRQGFNPGSVSGVLRYGFVESASDAASYPDRTGNGHNFVQDTANARPTFSATALNGRPGLVFDGSNDYIHCNTALAAAVVSNNSPFSVFFVGQYVANTGVDSLVSFQHESGAGRLTFGANAFVSPVGWRIVRTNDEGTEVTRPNLGPVTTDPFIVAVVFDGSNVAVYRNGQLLGTGALAGAGTTTVNFVALGTLVGMVGAAWTGVVAADAFYSRAVTTDERQYLERGYAARYGITLAT